MVRFFGKTRAAPRRDTRSKADGAPTTEGATDARQPVRPAQGAEARAAATPPAAKPAAARTGAAPARRTLAAAPTEKKPAAPRRRAPARPPRIDWAAEAAAAPLGAPMPTPSSLATAPEEHGPADSNGVAPAKRRRGTRGGRGRKKPAAATTAAVATPERDGPAPKPAPRTAAPATLEDAIAQQTAMLEAFTRDVAAALRTLQGAIDSLQRQGERALTANPRVGIFVDVPNLIYAAERRNISLDFGRVLDYFTRGRQLVRASAYAPISDDPQAKLENQRFVHHFVGHPYRIITKPLKRFADGSMKANFDIELAIDILTMSDRLDIVVLMSGDGDFARLVELIASRGVRVEVVAFGEAIAAELKSVADAYIDIGQHLDEFRTHK